MSDTAQSIIQDSLMEIKVLGVGTILNSADGALGLTLLNEMLDEWSNESLSCFANLEQSFPLVPGKQSYTIGPVGANITAPRPLELLTGQGAAYLTDINSNRYPVNVVEQDQWNSIGRLTNTSQLPDTLFYDPQFPLGIINIFPLPLIAYTVSFDARLQLANLSNLASVFSLPPGYRAAIKHNLSIRLWPYYKQGDPTPTIIGLALSTLGKVKRTNIRMSPSSYDSAVVSRAKSSYNIFNDGSTSGRNQ